MRRTKEEAQKTRESILDSALDLFFEKGVNETSLQDIAAHANVTRGAIYWHFQNKVEIFDALHDMIHQPLAEMILEDTQFDHPEPLVQVKELCIKLLLDLNQNCRKYKALQLFMSPYAYKGDLAPLREKHLQKKQESTRLFRLYFERAIERKMLPDDADPDIMNTALKCYMKGIINEYMNAPCEINLQETAPDLMDFFFNRII